MNETSLSLLDRIRETSDAESWDRLVALYAPLLKRWVRRYEVQDADADDIVQEVLAALLNELPKFQHNRQTGAFRSWLRTILVNRVRALLEMAHRSSKPPRPVRAIGRC